MSPFLCIALVLLSLMPLYPFNPLSIPLLSLRSSPSTPHSSLLLALVFIPTRPLLPNFPLSFLFVVLPFCSFVSSVDTYLYMTLFPDTTRRKARRGQNIVPRSGLLVYLTVILMTLFLRPSAAFDAPDAVDSFTGLKGQDRK